MSSPRLSADGLYYWDGARWIPTGARPAPVAHPQGAFRAPHRTTRTPSSWTRPVQTMIAGWYALQSALLFVLAIVVALNLSDWVNAFVLSEERAHPQDALPPPGFATEMTLTIGLYFFLGAVSALALFIVLIAGALRRWAWAHYVAMVALALEALTLPLTLFYSGMPQTARVLAVILAIAAAALCGISVVSAVRRGPWAMKRASVDQ